MTRVNLRNAPAWVTVLVCCVAQFMVVLDVAIVNVALPQMRHDLGLSANDQQWIINAYTLTFAGFLMLGGRAADLFGRKRVFMTGLALFTGFSLLGGLAQSGTWLIAARSLQGIGGAILAPATLSLLTSRFSEPDARRRALGAWSATAASGASAGLLAGGVLTQWLDWRWVLFVNVPIGIVVFVLALLGLEQSAPAETRRKLDVAGALTVTAGLGTLVYGIVETDAHPWGSARTLVTLAIGGLLLALFVLIESRLSSDPVVPLGIFRNRGLSVANGIAVMVGTALFGSGFFLSLYMQQVNGYSPIEAGVSSLGMSVAVLSASLLGPRLVVTLGSRRQLLIGLSTAAAGLIWLGLVLHAHDPYLSTMFGPMVLIGLGMGLSFVPMTLSATNGVPVQQAGLASALLNTTRQTGGAVGLAAMAAIAASVANGRHPVGAASAARALTAGYDWAFVASGLALAAGAALALALPRPEVAAAETDEPVAPEEVEALEAA